MTSVCPRCGCCWNTHGSESSQYLHNHRCGQKGKERRPEFFIRLAIEKLGENQEQRIDLARAWKRALRGPK
jgi:hypothetical protein